MTLQAAYKAYQAGQLDAAETAIQACLTRTPQDGSAWQLGALIAMKGQAAGLALDRIERSLSFPENRHEKLNTKGNSLRALGDDVEAEAAFRAAVKAAPEYAVARSNLAKCLFESSKYADAARHYAALTRKDPNHETAWRGQLHAQLEAQDLDTVEATLKAANLPDAELQTLRAKVDFYRGEYEQALSKLLPMVTHGDAASGTLALILQILHMTDRWDEGTVLIDTALSAHSRNPTLWGEALRALYRAGQREEACAQLSKAPDGLPVDLIALDLLIAQSKFAEARERAVAALRRAPGTPSLLKQLCRAALGAANFDMVKQVAEFGLRSTPNDQFYIAMIASAQRGLGEDHAYLFNYERYVRPFDLDPPKGWSDMASFNRDLKEALATLHVFRHEPLDQTLRSGTQTAQNLRFVDHPVIQAFFKAVAPAIETYISDLEVDLRHPLLRRNKGGYHIRSAWSVHLREGGHHVNHVHPRGWISSAYYVDAPERPGKEGWIKFGEPPTPIGPAIQQGPEHEIQPRSGRLVLFPSYLWHGTHAISGPPSRLTLPIDILPDRPKS